MMFTLGDLWVSLNKPCWWHFPGNVQTDPIVIILWECGFGRTQTLAWPFQQWPGCWFPLWFQVICCQGCCRSRERVTEIEQIKTSESTLFFTRVSHFSLRNIPWIVASVQSISRVLKKLVLTLFPMFLLLLSRRAL